MEVLQIQRGRESCCLVLVFGLSSSSALPGVWAALDDIWTTRCEAARPERGRQKRACLTGEHLGQAAAQPPIVRELAALRALCGSR
jgi:hypothetical protein